MATYNYTKSPVSIDRLKLEVEASSISSGAFEYANFNSPDSLMVSFIGTLTGEDKTTLDTIVSNHTGNEVYEPYGMIFVSDGAGGGEYVQVTEAVNVTSLSGTIPTRFTDLSDVPKTYIEGKHLRTTTSGLLLEGFETENLIYVHSDYEGSYSDGSFVYPFKHIYEAVLFAGEKYGAEDNVAVHMLPGEYILSYQVVVTNPAIKAIKGTDAGGVVMKPTNALLGQPFGIITQPLHISNITMDATDNPAFVTTSGSVGTKVTESTGTQIIFSDCIVKGFYTSFECSNGSNTWFRSVDIYDTTVGIDVHGVDTLIDADVLYIDGARDKHLYAHDAAEAYIGQSEFSSAYIDGVTQMGDGVHVDGENTYVEIFAGTNIWSCGRNLVVLNGAELKVDNCVLEETNITPGVVQGTGSNLRIVNSRGTLSSDDISIASPEYCYINAFDSTDDATTIGTGGQSDQNIFTFNTGQSDKPALRYEYDHSGKRAISFYVPTNGENAAMYSAANEGSASIGAHPLGTAAFDHDAHIGLVSIQGTEKSGWIIQKQVGEYPDLEIYTAASDTAMTFNYDGEMQLNSGVFVDKILDDDTFAGNDSKALVTQRSTKAFVEGYTYSKPEVTTISGVLDSRMLYADGTKELTADWDAGNYVITAGGFQKDKIKLDLAAFANITGVLTGGALSINTDNTKLDVAAGTCIYVDMTDRTDPTVELLAWPDTTIDSNLAGIRSRWVGAYKTGPGVATITTDPDFSALDRRSVAVIGRYWGGGTDTITGKGNYTTGAFSFGKSMEDLAHALGSINIKGNVITPGTEALKLNRSAGQALRFASGYSSSEISPNVRDSVTQNDISVYQYHLQGLNSTLLESDIDPNNYDLSGTKTSVPSGKWTVQRLYYFPGSSNVHVVYGQSYHDSMTLAYDSVSPELELNESILAGSILRAYLILKEGCTDLSDSNQSNIISAFTEPGLLPGFVNHGEMGGLQDDDHPQYLNTTRGDARYYTQPQVDVLRSLYVSVSGTTPLVGDWDAGPHTIEASGFIKGNTRVDYANYSNITGLLTGGALTINATDNTTIDVAAGTSLYVNMADRNNPTVEILSWPAQNYYPSISGIDTKWIGVERTAPGVGQIVSTHKFSQSEKRLKTVLGRVWNFNNTDEVEGVGNYKAGAFNAGKTVQDISYTLGSLNIAGNVFYATASGAMTLSRTEGEAFRAGANYSLDNTSPNIYTSSPEVGISDYSYHLQGTASHSYTEINPDEYDDGGVEKDVPTGKWTVQRVYYYPVSNVVLITYGQYVYDSVEDARDAAANEDLVLNTGTLEGSILRTFLILKEGCNDLTDTDQALILEASSTSVGGLGGVGGGTGVTDHGNLTGLGDDDHTQYVLHDGTRDFSDIISYSAHPTFSNDTELIDKKYVDDLASTFNLDHGGLIGIADDDHTQYSLANGTRDYSGIVSYNTPQTFTDDAQLVDKKYVDDTVVTDHGNLTGLGHDDHPQYSLSDGTRNYTDKVSYSAHPAFISDTEIVDKKYVDDSVGSVSTDHGSFDGLLDDDHPQYHNDARGDDRYYTKEQVDTISGTLAIEVEQLTSLATVQLDDSNVFAVQTTWSDYTFSNTSYENLPDVLEHDSSNPGRILVKADGTYSLSYGTVVEAQTTFTYTYGRILKNGSTVIGASDAQIRTYQTERHELTGSVTVDLQAGDYVRLQVSRSSDGAVNIIHARFNAIKLDGVQGDAGPEGPAGQDGADGVLTISGSADYFNGYDSAGTTQLGTSYTDIPLTAGYTTAAFSHSGAEITIEDDNTYLIVGRFTVSQPTTTSRSEAQMRLVVDTGGGYAEVPGTIGVCYSRTDTQGKSSASVHTVLDLNEGDKIKLQAKETSGGTLFGAQNGSGIMIFTTKGQTGPQGVQGPAGQDGADGTDGVDGEDGIDAGGTLAVVQARRTTTLDDIPLTWTDLTFDTTDIEYDDTLLEHDDTNRDRFLIKQDGYYNMAVNLSVDDEVTVRFIVNDTTVIPGSTRPVGNTSDANDMVSALQNACVAELSNGDYVTVQVQSVSTAENIFADATFIIFSMVGAKGADGADGAPGTPGSGTTLNIYDEDSSVTNTPHSILNFKGSAVTVTDAGGGQADVTINADSGVTIQDEGSDLTSTPHSTINFTGGGITATNNAGVATVNVDSPTPIFGSEYQIDTAEGETNTNSTSPVTKLTMNLSSIPAGDYRIGWYYEWRRNTASNDYISTVVVDSTTTVMEHSEESKDVNSWHPVCGFVKHTFTSGNHSIVFSHYGESSSNTSYTRRARLEIWRIS